MKDQRGASRSEQVSAANGLRGRRAQQFEDKQRTKWTVEGDGVNRAKIRKEMANAPRAFRLLKRAQMQHRQDIAHLMQHPLALAIDVSLWERKFLRNKTRAVRASRAWGMSR